MLVIGPYGKVGAVVDALGGAVVAKGIGPGIGEEGVGDAAGLLHAEVHHAQGGAHQVQGVDVVAGGGVHHGHGHGHLGGGVGLHGEAVVLHAFHVGSGVAHAVVHHVGVEAHGKLAFLQAAAHAATAAAGGGHGHDGSVEALGHGGTAGSFLVGGDVEYATHALGVVFHARVGDYLDVLHAAGGHHLEDGGGVLGKHLVGLPVHIHLEAAAAVHGNVILAVHTDHGHFAEHVQHGAGLGVGVVLYIIGHLVHFHLHQRTHGGHLAGLQHLGAVLGQDLAQVHLGRIGRDGEGAALHFPAHVVKDHYIISRQREAVGEVAFLVGGGEGNLLRIRKPVELKDGGGLSHAGEGIQHYSLDSGFLGEGAHTQKRCGKKDY